MNVSLSTVYQMQGLARVKYKYGISSLLNIRSNDVMSSSQAAYPDTQQEASSTIPPTTTSITRLRWSASRRIWRDTSPGRSALRPSWGYAAPKVCWHTRDCSVKYASAVFITENIFETFSFLSSLVEKCLLPLLSLFFQCFGLMLIAEFNPFSVSPSLCRSVHPHVPRKLLCALHRSVVPPQREPRRWLRCSDVHRRKPGRHAGCFFPGCSALYIKQRYAHTARRVDVFWKVRIKFLLVV